MLWIGTGEKSYKKMLSLGFTSLLFTSFKLDAFQLTEMDEPVLIFCKKWVVSYIARNLKLKNVSKSVGNYNLFGCQSAESCLIRLTHKQLNWFY
jgi:hypothetical protein